jgi:membrane-bound serine protease (ClpP class)
VILPTTGIVDEGMARYLEDGIDQAERDGAAAVVIKLNTPGGFLTATNDIVGTILEAQVPVIVWVAPAGGFAASAGTFITLAANVAVMAPGTSIGAASPVSADGSEIDPVLAAKVKNDAIAKITAIAEARDRNVEWAVTTVKDARSSRSAGGKSSARSTDGRHDRVLASPTADGRGRRPGDHPRSAGARRRAADEPVPASSGCCPTRTCLPAAEVGSAGLLAEVWAPNFVTGIIGALAIILAFIGLGALPLNVGGLILIVFAIVLFGLELTVTSHGLLGFGGVVCLGLGASALFSTPGDPFQPLARVAMPVILTVSITFGVIMVLVVWAPSVPGASGRPRQPPRSSSAASAASAARSNRRLRLRRQRGGSARSNDDGPIERDSIRVIAVEGLTLVVEPDASSSLKS